MSKRKGSPVVSSSAKVYQDSAGRLSVPMDTHYQPYWYHSLQPLAAAHKALSTLPPPPLKTIPTFSVSLYDFPRTHSSRLGKIFAFLPNCSRYFPRQRFCLTYAHVCSVAQLCPTLCNPRDCSPPDSSVYGVFQAQILEQFAIFHSRDLPNPGIEPTSLASPALASRFFTTEPPEKSHVNTQSLNQFNWPTLGGIMLQECETLSCFSGLIVMIQPWKLPSQAQSL